jgi:hypothetical protein
MSVEMFPAAEQEMDRLATEFQAVSPQVYAEDPEAVLIVCGYFKSEELFVPRAAYAVWPSGRVMQANEALDQAVALLRGGACPVCGGSGVRCCEFGADAVVMSGGRPAGLELAGELRAEMRDDGRTEFEDDGRFDADAPGAWDALEIEDFDSDMEADS